MAKYPYIVKNSVFVGLFVNSRDNSERNRVNKLKAS